MPGKIALDVAPPGAECVICPNPAAFKLTLGVGYREPAHLCGNCTAVLRITLAPSNLAKTQYDAGRAAYVVFDEAHTHDAANLVRLFSDNATRNKESV